MKNIYTAPEIDIVSFETEDVITTSAPESPMIPAMMKHPVAERFC